MKTLLITVFALFVLVGCSEDEPTTPSDTNTSSANSFNVDGNGYSNASFKGYIADSASIAVDNGAGFGVITFFGKGSKTDEVFVMTLTVDDLKAGKYIIDPTMGVSMNLVTTVPGTTTTYMGVSGEIDVKSWDAVGGRAKGTFSGKAILAGSATLITISDGKFDAKRK